MQADGVILLFSRDVGATNQLLAVLDAFARLGGGAGTRWDNDSLIESLLIRAVGESSLASLLAKGSVVMGKDFALERFRQAGVTVQDWGELEASGATVADMLEALQVKLVITGTTDVDDRTDVEFWEAARRCGIPSVVFLDHVSSLDLRFRNPHSQTVLPDFVYLPNAFGRQALLDLGMSRLALTEGPDLHLEKLARKTAIDDSEIAAKRGEWVGNRQVSVVLFVSECTREVGASYERLPYDEVDVAHQLTCALRRGIVINGRVHGPDDTLLIIRPHPKDRKGKYDAFRSNLRPTTLIDGTTDLCVALSAADTIIGMDSTVLHEAKILGRPTFSVVSVGWFARVWGNEVVLDLGFANDDGGVGQADEV